MTAEALIDRLSAIHPKGYDLTLGRIRTVLGKLGDPQLRIPPAIHVAGTNGKGSTVAFCRSMLEAAGRKVHVHTSPHLVNWHERFRLGAEGGGELVEDAVLEAAIERVVAANEGAPITIFEILTAAMFLLFSEHPADCCLIEVGLGGRFDATNVVEAPLASVITNIALDHQTYLGDRVELIAAEKAGIIKRARPVVIGPQSDVVCAVLEEVALTRGAPAFVAGQDFVFFEQAGRFVYQDETGLLDLPLPRLAGAHQLANAATAIAALRICDLGLTEADFERGLETVYWPGRMERLKSGALDRLLPAGSPVEVWIDGGHNPSAGSVISHFLADLDERLPMPVFMITGMLNTKDPAGFFAAFEGIAERVFTVPIASSDAGVDPRELAGFARSAKIEATPSLSVGDALSAISGLLVDGEPARIVICGSLYLIGEVLHANGTPPK